jgi:hypothetical protein
MILLNNHLANMTTFRRARSQPYPLDVPEAMTWQMVYTPGRIFHGDPVYYEGIFIGWMHTDKADLQGLPYGYSPDGHADNWRWMPTEKEAKTALYNAWYHSDYNERWIPA